MKLWGQMKLWVQMNLWQTYIGGDRGLGLRFLTHNPWRFAGALVGVAVAVTIMFVELGLLLGVLESQALVARRITGDLVVMDQARIDLHKWTDIRDIRLKQIAAQPGVAEVIPIYQGTMGLRNPPDRRVTRIAVFAFAPDRVPFDIGDPARISELLRRPGTVLFDKLSRPIYGDIRTGQSVELDEQLYRVMGKIGMGADVVHDGAVIMGEGDWLSRNPHDAPIMGSIHLEKGANVARVQKAILAQLPPDITVLTPAELRLREFAFTLRAAPIGILFGIGMLAGLVIGAVTCYQILFNEIVDRLKQYATLRAMGFPDHVFRRIMMEQAAVLTLGGFILGCIIAALAYAYLAHATSLAIGFDLSALALIFVLTLGMTMLAGLLALKPVAHADPAALY